MATNSVRHAIVLGLGIAAACTSQPPVDADLVIQNVTVIDGTDAPPRPDQSVAIRAGHIIAIAQTTKVHVKPDTRSIDGRGKYLVPGLWDMHVHLFGYGEHSFPLFLANGVTTIRDLSGNLAVSIALRESVRSGKALGPDMLIAGPTLDADYVVRAVAGTPYAAAREAVPDPAAAVAIVDSLARAGVDQIKVHSLTPRAAYFAILEEAKKKGIPVVGHVPDSVSLREAILAGQRTIEHDSKLEYEESPRGAELVKWWLAATQKVYDRTIAEPKVGQIFPIRLAAADSARAGFDSATAAQFGEFAAKHPVWFDPTLAVIEILYRSDDPAYRQPAELKYAPPSALEMDEGIVGKENATQAEIDAGVKRFNNHLIGIPPLLRAGVKLIAGTDVPVVPLVPGFSLLRELELLVDAGLSPKQALQAATRNAADAAGKLAQTGTIEVGKLANLLLLDADPLASISNARRVNAVVVHGKLLDRATLDQMLAAAEAYAKQPAR